MSAWDELIFTAEVNGEYLDDLRGREPGEISESLADTISLALQESTRDSDDYLLGLCAASVVAIWCGAPYSSADVAAGHEFIQAGIGECPIELQDKAAELLDAELEAAGSSPLPAIADALSDSDVPEGLETYAEALS